jgi:hypothetical protein
MTAPRFLDGEKPIHMMTEAELDQAWDEHHERLLAQAGDHAPAWLTGVIREKAAFRAERALRRERAARVAAERRAEFESRKKSRVIDLPRVEQARVVAWWLYHFDAAKANGTALSLEWIDAQVPKAGWPPNHEPEILYKPDPELDALEKQFADHVEPEKESSILREARKQFDDIAST